MCFLLQHREEQNRKKTERASAAVWLARERRDAHVAAQQAVVRKQMLQYQQYSNAYGGGATTHTVASMHGMGGHTWEELARNDTAVARYRNDVVDEFCACGNISAWKKKSMESKPNMEDIEHCSDDSYKLPTASKAGQAALKRSSVQIPSDDDDE